MPSPADIPVTYTNGILRPDHPLTDIPEGARFHASLRPAPAASLTSPASPARSSLPTPGARAEPTATTPADRATAAAARALDQIRRIRDSGLFQSGSRKLNRDQTPDRR